MSACEGVQILDFALFAPLQEEARARSCVSNRRFPNRRFAVFQKLPHSFLRSVWVQILAHARPPRHLDQPQSGQNGQPIGRREFKDRSNRLDVYSRKPGSRRETRGNRIPRGNCVTTRTGKDMCSTDEMQVDVEADMTIPEWFVFSYNSWFRIEERYRYVKFNTF